MIDAPYTCYTTVSDLALCQKCPALLAYKQHYGKRGAWRVGINGNGFPYGSMFHKHIAQVFFEAAAHPSKPLHAKIAAAIPGGFPSLGALIRDEIFLPFVSCYSDRLDSGQIMAMARGVDVWVRAMCEFFRIIPSLIRYPQGNMSTVFVPPEQKLQSFYEIDGCRLVITGCYDALMFNPDRAEARLFEFKGYMKSDITVPLSQSLIYSWLIERLTGIVPSVEIIYLDEKDKAPDVFDSRSVKDMIQAGLPDLFRSAFDVISLRRKPEILRDKNLCSVCKFNKTCQRDYDNAFKRSRPGASLVSVMVFFMMALMLTAQMYFFTALSLEDSVEEREVASIRMKLDVLIDEADEQLKHHIDNPSTRQYNNNFHDTTKIQIDEIERKSEDKYHVQIHSLNYSFDIHNSSTSYGIQNRDTIGNEMHKRIFAAMPPENPYKFSDIISSSSLTDSEDKAIFNAINDDVNLRERLKVRKYYLLRAYTTTMTARHIMLQVLVVSDDTRSVEFTKDEIKALPGLSGINIEDKIYFPVSNKHERLTYMEVWY